MNMSVQAALDLLRHSEPTRRMSASARIYDDLRQRILSLELPPGTSLLRSELADKYEVSQTPLRDALQRLEQNGLVQVFPQSRTLVTRIDVPKIHEAHFLRVALETEVVRHLARLDAQQRARTVACARSVIEMQRAVTSETGQIRLFQELDEHFHRVLFEALDHDSLHGLIRSRSGHLDRVRRLQVHSPEKIESILAGHEAILAGVASGDEDAAMEGMRAHLRKAPNWVDEFRASHGDYFA